MSELVRFGVSLERDLLTAFDRHSERKGFANRSEALRHCIRRELSEEIVSDPRAPVAGVLTLVYDHHDNDLPARLTALQHEAHGMVIATMHVHLDAHHCLEVIVLRGETGLVQDIANLILGTKGVKNGRLVVTTTGQHI